MDHYTTLGVAKNAAPDELKKAYRKLASQHHPDKGGDTAHFQKIQAAYETLSDPQKRQIYDNPQPQGMPGGFHFNFNGGPSGGPGFPDIFAQMFKQHQHQARQPQQQIYRTTVWITLEQVYSGGNQILQLQTPSGNHNITIEIPKGVPDGGQVKCDNVISGAILMVEFRIHKHLKFERNGNDLQCNYSISILDLIVGTTFEFITLSGTTLEVTVQPKMQPYMHLKLIGHGLPITNNDPYAATTSYGDQLILIKPFVPAIIDENITNSILQSRVK